MTTPYARKERQRFQLAKLGLSVAERPMSSLDSWIANQGTLELRTLLYTGGVSYCARNGMSFDDVRLRHGQGSEQIMRMYLHLAPEHDSRFMKMIPNIAIPERPVVGPRKVAASC